MPPLRHLFIGGILTAVIVTGSAVAGLGPFPQTPSDGTPGWDGEGHELVVNQSISVGEKLTVRVAAASPTADGGRIVVGFRRFSLRAFTDDRVATAWRLGPDGEIRWRVDLAANESYAQDIVATEDGFAVAGIKGGNAFIVRLRADGSVSDRVVVDRDGLVTIGGLAAAPDGGVILVGYERFDAPDRAFSHFEDRVQEGSGWAIRTDGDGERVWTRNLAAIPRDVIADGNGFLAVGEVSVEKWNATIRPWIQRFSGEQSVDWTRIWAQNNSRLTTIAPADDGYVLGGRFLRFDADARDYLYTATVFGAGPDGSYRWTRVLTATGQGTFTDAAALPDGSVALTGTVDADQATNIAVVTATGTGVTGAAVLGGPRFDSASAVWATPQETLAVTGDVEQGGEAERHDILFLELRLTGSATPLLPPEEVADTRADVTLSPTTTRPDVVYGDTSTETTQNETPTTTDEAVITNPEKSGFHVVGLAIYAAPFAVVGVVLLAVRRRLR